VAAASIVSFTLTLSHCAGDGSFDPYLYPNRSSWYCRAVHFRSVGLGIVGAVLIAVLFLLPTIAVTFGAVRVDRTGERRSLVGPAVVSVAVILASFAMVVAAKVTAVPQP
jgi:hypothetical protein